MPVIPRVGGLGLPLHSGEGAPREPPNVHVIQERDEAKFWLTPEVSLAYNDGFGARRPSGIWKPAGRSGEGLGNAWHERFTRGT